MTPAQRRRRRVKAKARKSGKKSIKKFLVVIFLAIFLFLLLIFQTKFWSSSAKSFLVIQKKSGDIVVSVFDPELEKITNIVIPKNTEVGVARQLGVWKLGSVWRLGENEGIGGRLLAETIVKHFKLPVVAWADSLAEGLAMGDLLGVTKGSLLPYKTNLGMGDKIRIGLFSIRIKNFKREDINLSESNVLRKTRLIDGEEGYVLVGDLPNWLNALFSNPDISDAKVKVIIYDATGKVRIAEEVGEVVEVMGAKLASVKKEKAGDFDCEISGREKRIANEVAKVFSCQKLKRDPEGNFDLEIRLGKEFARRF